MPKKRPFYQTDNDFHWQQDKVRGLVQSTVSEVLFVTSSMDIWFLRWAQNGRHCSWLFHRYWVGRWFILVTIIIIYYSDAFLAVEYRVQPLQQFPFMWLKSQTISMMESNSTQLYFFFQMNFSFGTSIRGRLSMISMFLRNIGILLAYIIGSTLPYKYVPCICLTVPIVFFIFFAPLQNTCLYYLNHGKPHVSNKRFPIQLKIFWLLIEI